MRILIAEDDANLRDGLADLLASEGYVCDAVGDGAEAKRIYALRRHPLAVVDVVMPRTDGLTLCRHIRDADPKAQILLLSARSETHDRVLGIEFGADDYLAKPFDPRELLARVGAMARRCRTLGGGASAEEEVLIGDLTLEPAALRARRGERRIDLTAREVDLLLLLFRSAGRALSRDDILDACWGRAHMPESRALDQYVSALRRKIEVDPARPAIISTVRGVGYRYDPPDKDLTRN